MQIGTLTRLSAVSCVTLWLGCMAPAHPIPEMGEPPDTKRLTRDFVGVGGTIGDDAMFLPAPGSEEPLGDAMYPGSSETPQTITDAFPRKFEPDGTALEKPSRSEQR